MTYKDFITKMLAIIESKQKVIFYDDTTIGAKHTDCIGELVGGHNVHYKKGQGCPFDNRLSPTHPERNEDLNIGCFYSCRIFRGRSDKRIRMRSEMAQVNAAKNIIKKKLNKSNQKEAQK